MDHLTALEMADVASRHYESGNPLAGLGIVPPNIYVPVAHQVAVATAGDQPIQAPSFWRKALYGLTGDQRVLGLPEEKKVTIPARLPGVSYPGTPPILPGKLPLPEEKAKEEEEVENKKQQDAKDFCEKEGGTWNPKIGCMVPLPYKIPKWTPWAVAGGLGVLILVLAVSKR